MSNETTLDDVLALVAKATPGEWRCFLGTGKYRSAIHSERGHVAFCTMRNPTAASAGLDRPEMEANAQSIAAAVNYLRAHGDELRAALEDARRLDALDRMLAEHGRLEITVIDASQAPSIRQVIDAAQEVGRE